MGGDGFQKVLRHMKGMKKSCTKHIFVNSKSYAAKLDTNTIIENIPKEYKNCNFKRKVIVKEIIRH